VSVHPEGKRYAHNNTENGISLVTEAHVADHGVTEQLENCLAMVRTLAARENVHLPRTTDLFLEFDEISGNCSYWFADHAHRTVFWLHTVDTSTVGLPDSYSKNHLRESLRGLYLARRVELRRLEYLMEENYWTHVEMFPATAAQYSMTAINELHIIFMNARAGKLRNTSVLPWE
jgi:hypothetical protein